MPKLSVLKGPDAGKLFELTGASITVGRHSGNAVPLTDSRVSRRHLELRAAPNGGYQLFDLGSGNGTQVNNRHVQVIDLRPGDQIAIGDTVLIYLIEQPTAQVNFDAPAAARFVVRENPDAASAILRTVGEDYGSQILSRADRAGTDWLRTRLANLSVMYEAANAVSHILDVDELLNRVMDLILRAAEADHGCFMVVDTETGELMPKAVRTRPELLGSTIGGGDFVVSRTVIDHVLKNRQGVLVADASSDERFRGGESIARYQIREVICVPMKGRHETVGVLFLDTRMNTGSGIMVTPTAVTVAPKDPLKFTEDHLHLAVAIAHQAALAVEETRYYQALVQAERLAAVGQTIAALSHHIKNIMQGVRFGSDMVRSALDGTDPEMLQKGWRLVEKNQKKIDELILDMLSYSKDREPGFEPTDLNKLIEEVLDVVRGRAQSNGVTLEFTANSALGEVPCDPDGIHRALLNVVSNAIDATEDRPDPRVSVVIRQTADGAFAEIAVTDTGPGIPPDKIDDIFKPFVSTKGARGTGLGLPVSRKVLLEHGGDVVLQSTLGMGSTFTLRIPVKPIVPLPPPASTNPMRVTPNPPSAAPPQP